jgi:Xaa-Pro aminopeptidase
MSRAAVAGARLAMLTEAWAALASRIRHTTKSRAELRAAERAMAKADEALSRALSDLRAAVPVVPLTKAEQAQRAYEARVAKAKAARAGDTIPRPIPGASGRDGVAQAKDGDAAGA